MLIINNGKISMLIINERKFGSFKVKFILKLKVTNSETPLRPSFDQNNTFQVWKWNSNWFKTYHIRNESQKTFEPSWRNLTFKVKFISFKSVSNLQMINKPFKCEKFDVEGQGQDYKFLKIRPWCRQSQNQKMSPPVRGTQNSFTPLDNTSQ